MIEIDIRCYQMNVKGLSCKKFDDILKDLSIEYIFVRCEEDGSLTIGNDWKRTGDLYDILFGIVVSTDEEIRIH